MLKANSGKIIVKQLEKPNVSPSGVEYNGENFLVVSIEDILAFESDFDN